MALSMDEQRILAEIEQQITRDDPSLATRLTTFGLRRRRADRDERRRALVRVTALVMIAVFVIGILVAVYAAVLNSSRHRPAQTTGRGTTSAAPVNTEPNIRAPLPQHEPSR
jgi:hypothetical protein